jgi:hypothetical protein
VEALQRACGHDALSMDGLTERAFSRAAPPHGKSAEHAAQGDRGSERRRVGCNAELGRGSHIVCDLR